MRDTLKVAKWEIKRNVRNKAFIISILITPVMMLLFGLIPTLMTQMEANKPFTLYIIDELGVFSSNNPSSPDNLEFVLSSESSETLAEKLRGQKDKGFVVLNENALKGGNITIFSDREGQGTLSSVSGILESALYNHKLTSMGFTSDQIEYLNQTWQIGYTPLTTPEDNRFGPQKYIPAIFAGILFLTIFTSGTMTFQSALQEKKDKMVELILSSISSQDLMQGKILGYFILGLIQVAVWLCFGIPAAQLIMGIPVLQFLMVPEIIPMVFFALAGYLLYSAIFVAIGATMEDAQSGSSFQGIILLIPMLPLFVIGPIIENPSGSVALIGSFFPLTTPGVMLARLSVSQHVPVWQILFAAALLVLTVLLVMRLAGKVFKTAILMYGKNASLKEVIKWMRY